MRTLVITPASAPGEPHHELLMKGVRRVWAQWGRPTLDVAVVTEQLALHELGGGETGAGPPAVVPGDEKPPETQRPALAAQVAALAHDHDLAFLLLSGTYLSALHLPLPVPARLQQVYLTSHEGLDLLADLPGVEAIVADGALAARRWHIKAGRVRGFLFARLCGQIVEHGPALLEWLQRRPQDTERLFYKRARWRPQWPLWDE